MDRLSAQDLITLWPDEIGWLQHMGALAVLGAGPLLDVLPVVPVLGNVALGVGALSYAGHLAVMAVGDRAICPDLDVLVAGLDDVLQSLTYPTPAQS